MKFETKNHQLNAITRVKYRDTELDFTMVTGLVQEEYRTKTNRGCRAMPDAARITGAAAADAIHENNNEIFYGKKIILNQDRKT